MISRSAELKPGSIWAMPDHIIGTAAKSPQPAASESAPQPLDSHADVVVAWGDSVTVGGGILPDVEKGYQAQWVRRLKAAYPAAATAPLRACSPSPIPPASSTTFSSTAIRSIYPGHPTSRHAG